jgi:ribosome-associated protein
MVLPNSNRRRSSSSSRSLTDPSPTEAPRRHTLVDEQAIGAASLARRAVEIAEDKQASEIVMLDLRELNTVADYFVICSGESDRQLRAIVEGVEETIEQNLDRSPRIEGTPDSGWVVLDYGDVVVHIFSVALRDYYRLDRLWSKATPVVVVQ